ncbi:MAG: hypothetical protein ACXAES_00300 [Promethearchaeota archaeon]|jgi:hypothetical protein
MQNKYQGWIEGFGNVVDEQLGVETKEKVLQQCISCQKISNDDDMAQCIKEVMIQFDQVVPDKEKRDKEIPLWKNWEIPVFIIFSLKSPKM